MAGASAAVRLLLLGLLLAAAAPGWAEDLGAGFLSLLSTVPETAPTYAAAPMFEFLDLRALEDAAALQHPVATSQFDAWSEAERVRWIAAFRRVQSNNELLSLSSASRGRMPQAVGFDWFDIDRVLSFWGPPDTVTVVAGSRLPDLARLEAALIPRSFARRIIGSSAILGRFEDGALPNLAAREPADPFGGTFGLPERIAVEPGMLLAAHRWSGIEQVLAARLLPPERRFIQPFAAKALKALGALGGASTTLIQAVAFSIDKIQPLSPELEGILRADGLGLRSGDLATLSRLWAGARGAGKAMLPAYPIVLLLDLQAGKDQLAVMALPYGDDDAAEAAASLLAARLGSWVAEDGATPLIEATGGTMEHRAVLAGAGSPALALVVVRYPMPADPGVAGRHFGAWLRAIYRRSFLPLAVAD